MKCNATDDACLNNEPVEMTINEIINGDTFFQASDVLFLLLLLIFIGDGKEFPGLVPLIRNFLDGADVDVDTRCTISQYLSFIQVYFFLIRK
jgi:hypothetical protein